jgi:hypothetical protein
LSNERNNQEHHTRRYKNVHGPYVAKQQPDCKQNRPSFAGIAQQLSIADTSVAHGKRYRKSVEEEKQSRKNIEKNIELGVRQRILYEVTNGVCIAIQDTSYQCYNIGHVDTNKSAS